MNTGKPLKELTDEQLQQTVKTFAATITVISGCTIDNRMMLPTLKVIKKFLLTYYPFLTLAELNEAFEMNAAGLFEETVSHYNRSLNCEFIGKVLAHYRDYRRQQMEQIVAVKNALPPEIGQINQLPAKTMQPNTDDLKEIVEAAYAWFLKGAQIIGAGMIYDYMVRLEILPPMLFEEYFDRAKARLRGRFDNEIQAIVNSKISDGSVSYTFGAAYTGMAMDLQRKVECLKTRKIDEALRSEIISEAKTICLNIEFKKFADAGKPTIFAHA